MAAGSPSPAPQDADFDVQLMLRVQAGSREAFGELLQRNHRRVLNLAYRYLGDRNAAEDAAQETFLKLYQARDRYRPEAKFSSYLLRIAANVCLSRLRRKKVLRLQGGGPEADEGTDPADPGAVDPGAEALDRELAARVRAAVERLPDRQRMAILLNKFEGLGYAEVGERLGLSPAATKSLLHRARMALKSMLEEYLQ